MTWTPDREEMERQLGRAVVDGDYRRAIVLLSAMTDVLPREEQTSARLQRAAVLRAWFEDTREQTQLLHLRRGREV